MISLLELVINLALCGAILVVSRFLWNYFRSPLKSFPGPIPSSFTDIWRMQDVFRGRCDITHNKLHRKHGTAVRMGPNLLSLSDPSLINLVYNTKSPWIKSNMYNVNDVLVGGNRLSNLFSSQDEKWHSTYIRPVKNLYSMSKVQDVETTMDITINLFFDKLRERFVRTDKPCEMSDWINFFAWDVMSQVTFSQDLGILEAGSDYKGFLGRSAKTLDYFAPICQVPILDMFLDKNPIARIGPPTFVWANIFSLEQLQKRYQENDPTGRADFLSKFLKIKEKNPELVDDNTVILYLLSNVLAGSDSTAGTMCAAIYHILKNPSVHKRLCDELHSANLSFPAQWKEVQGLTYLEAVMRETMRVNPGVGLILERVVPTGGLNLPDGRFVPEGTVVGMNPWVINQNEEVFGTNTEDFRPERWLQSPDEPDEAFQARFSKMKSTDFTFGAGSRACLGRYLSQLESFKLIATLFDTFDMKLPSPEHEWKLTNSWFIYQKNIPVHLAERV
ncbi:cytochrome P450 [Penicillium macrosclerotiorum]|uniref:cytochrome P450 n=1 Tax=Penicillium macrosclerotiorum TaxID=303699 RepID=UPI00254715D0|nr:cytochrome P450 [Penicillium macrosclerotiorum]KAJ5692601.1 cytochrome P450 [Penicillium macrosclerotiorum]